MKIERIKITSRDIKKCEEFAHGQIDTSIDHYRNRKQGNRDKIIQDIITGKLGEIAAFRLLRGYGINTGQPDFEIYNKGRKSFDADLSNGQYKFHCKTQSEDSVSKYGVSWILQWGGKGHGHVDKLFKARTPSDYCVISAMDDNGYCNVYGIVQVELLFKNDLIRPPAVKWLEDCKRAIYFEDIKNLSWRQRWGVLKNTIS